MHSDLPPIIMSDRMNYIGAFLTFSCQLRCSYCINHHGGDLVKGRKMNGEQWINGLSRIKTRPDLPITIQGGEPSVHPAFIEITTGLPREIKLDLLTNLERDLEFWKRLGKDTFKRPAPYASIRVSYHHKQSTLSDLTMRVLALKKLGYDIGVWEVDHPEYHNDCLERQKKAKELGIDWRLKEFLGPYEGRDYGTIRYPASVNDPMLKRCDCRTSELLIGPGGYIFRCHSDLYANRSAIGHILDPLFTHEEVGKWRPCNVYGRCNSCDVKVKTNRFQVGGHSSVEIKNIGEGYASNSIVETVENTYGKRDGIPTPSSLPSP